MAIRSTLPILTVLAASTLLASCEGETAGPGGERLPPPSGLTATLRADGTVLLNWETVSVPIDHYGVLRKAGHTTQYYLFARIGTVNGPPFVDQGPLDSGTTYNYQVVAAKDGEVSPRSNTVQIRTP